MKHNKIASIILIHLCILCIPMFCSSQSTPDTAIKIDNLKAPSSPASNLIGIAASEIEKPSTPSGLMLSVRNASQNFSSIPNKYAVDIAPLILLKGVTVQDLQSKKIGAVFQQSFVFSTAINQISKEENKEDSVDLTKLGLGFKFSLIRGKLNNKYLNAIAKITEKHNELLKKYSDDEDGLFAFQEKDPEYVQLTRERDALLKDGTPIRQSLTDSIESLAFDLKTKYLESTQSDTELKSKIKNELEETTLDRIGGFLDVSGGISLDFLQNNFDNSKISKAGIWVTGGYDNANNFSSMGIVRYLYSPEQVYAKAGLSGKLLHTLDLGGKLSLVGLQKKLNVSFEGIYRSVLTKNTVDPSWRLILNAEYDVATNQKLTFSFGRNFDGTYYKGGNVVSAINFIVGLGKMPVKSSVK